MASKTINNFSELNSSAPHAAKRLLGCILERELDGQKVRVKIVETEAYDQSDAASHSYKGRTQRTEVMFGPAGYLYVYFTYGMHYCCNIVVGSEGQGSAVLIRAVEPISDKQILEQYRGKKGIELTNGPAKLCQALSIGKQLNGHYLNRPPLRLIIQPSLPSSNIVTTTRIGISKATDKLWRFYTKDSKYVSR